MYISSVKCFNTYGSHKVENGFRTFPLNKFFLSCIKRKEDPEANQAEKCEDHGKEFIFFGKSSADDA